MRVTGDLLPLALIAAVGTNGVIGAANRMPWRLPGDFRHFKRTTMGKPVLMGRRTYDSIGGPLPGRSVVVLSRDPAFAPEGVTTVRTIADGLDEADVLGRAVMTSEIMVAGGGTLYAALIGRAQRLYVTEVELAPEGDTMFPAIDPARWRETSRSAPRREERDEAAYTFVTYERA